MTSGPIRLGPRGRAAYIAAVAQPGPPPRNPNRPTRAEERRHQADRRVARKAIEAKGHRLARFKVRPRTFGWKRWAVCDLQSCGFIVWINHRNGAVTWERRERSFYPLQEFLDGDGTAGVPICVSPMANRAPGASPARPGDQGLEESER